MWLLSLFVSHVLWGTGGLFLLFMSILLVKLLALFIIHFSFSVVPFNTVFWVSTIRNIR